MESRGTWKVVGVVRMGGPRGVRPLIPVVSKWDFLPVLPWVRVASGIYGV